MLCGAALLVRSTSLPLPGSRAVRVDIGGVPAFAAAAPDSAYDSWLTIGATDGSLGNALASIGIDWDSWDESTLSCPPTGLCS